MDVDDEARLLERAKAGDAESFGEAVSRHLPMLFAYSRAISGDFHAAQDVVQETVMIAYRKIDHYFPEADFAAWLRSIARREALAARRRLSKVELATAETIEHYYEGASLEPTSRREEALTECVERLNGRMHQVIRGHYFDGKPLAELAVALETSVTAAKQLLYRTRLALRDCVNRRLAAQKG